MKDTNKRNTAMGYYVGNSYGNIDIMQSLDSRASAGSIWRLAAEGNFDSNEAVKYIPDTGYGLFKRIFPSGNYDFSAATIEMSIMGGTVWYMYKGSFQKYGDGSTTYGTNVEFVLSTMR